MIEVGLMGVCSEVEPKVLSTLNGMHSDFHKKMWYYQKMYLRFKRLNAMFNALALLCIAVPHHGDVDGVKHAHQRVDGFQETTCKDGCVSF